jgi:heat shock protein HslJ/LysM repeat protein
MKKLTLFVTLLIVGALWWPVISMAQEPVACESDYTVQLGDWLSKIADKYYGDVLAYPAIVAATNAQAGDTYAHISDPDLIEPGWTLCIPSAADASALLAASGGGTAPAPAGLSTQELGNATYHGIYAEPVTLTDGKYEGAPFVEGGASRPTVTLIPEPVGYGDLNGDGQADAAVLLAESSGGSGTFIYLAAMVVQDGGPQNVATTLLGDRVQVQSLTIEAGQIVVKELTFGPDDPMCCPSQEAVKTFELQGDQLVETSSQTGAGAAGPQLAGTVWQWQETLMNNDDKFVPDNPGNYTMQLMADGSVAVQADCNQVSGTYTLDGNRISIELGPSTMAACPEGSLGDQFVANLGAASIYSFDQGDLLIDLKFDSGTMRFSAQSSELAGTSWSVISYNNGRGGVVSVMIGTELTATFGADGTVTGSAGCNTYRAGYEVDGNKISIGLPASTMMACAEPEGIMEQEQEYLTALSTVATYQITGDRMEMRTAEGSTAATFQRVK